jgi:hypothetical protein
MIRDQNKMLFIDRKKFGFEENIPGDQAKDIGIDHWNKTLLPLI